MAAQRLQRRRDFIPRPQAYLFLGVLAAAAIAASGCSTTRQTRYSLQEGPEASSWATQTQDQAWMELYTGNSTSAE